MTRFAEVISKRSLALALALILCMTTLGILANSETSASKAGPSRSTPPPSKEVNKKPASDEAPVATEPCTVFNPLTKQFYDLRSLGRVETTVDGKSTSVPQPWMAYGYDYGGNFTVGVCSSPILHPENLRVTDFPDVSNKSDVAALYSPDNQAKIALGVTDSKPKFRGKKLVLEYHNGDLCPNTNKQRRSALLMFTCDRALAQKAAVSFVGSPDNCSYFFEVRTMSACATVAQEEKLGILWIAMLIIGAAAATFFGAGVLYTFLRGLGIGAKPNV